MNQYEHQPAIDWNEEAKAIISDIGAFVSSIKIAQECKSNCERIFFDIETLEQKIFVVCMSSIGFTICPSHRNNSDFTNSPYGDSEKSRYIDQGSNGKVYETINALLDDNSEGYREEFARTLSDKIRSIEQSS